MQLIPVGTIYRDLGLALMITAIFIILQYAMDLFYQWYKLPYRKIRDLRFQWSIFLVTLLLNLSCFVISDFYAMEAEREIWLKLGYFVMLIGIGIFSNIFERSLEVNTRNIFGILGIGSAIAIVFIPQSIMRTFAYFVLSPIYVSLFLFFAINLLKSSRGLLRTYAVVFLVSFIVSIFGYFFILDVAIEYFGTISYIIGASIIASGIVISTICIGKLQSFSEIDWAMKIREIFLFHENGIPLFHIYMGEPDPNYIPDWETLASGALSIIKSILTTLTKSKGEMRSIDHENVKLLFGKYKELVIVVISEEDMVLIWNKIKQFLKGLKEIYPQKIPHPSDIRVFGPAKALAIEIFQPPR